MPIQGSLAILHTLRNLDATFQSLYPFQPGQRGHYNPETNLFERSWAARSLFDEHSGRVVKAVGQTVETVGRTLTSTRDEDMFEILSQKVSLLQSESSRAKEVLPTSRPWVQKQLVDSLTSLQTTLNKVLKLPLPALRRTCPDSKPLQEQSNLIKKFADTTLPSYLNEIQGRRPIGDYTDDDINSLFTDHATLDPRQQGELIPLIDDERSYILHEWRVFDEKAEDPSQALIGLMSYSLQNRVEQVDSLFQSICESHRNKKSSDDESAKLTQLIRPISNALSFYEEKLAENLVRDLKAIQKIADDIVTKRCVQTSLKPQLLAHQTVEDAFVYHARLIQVKDHGFSVEWLEDCAVDARRKSQLNKEVIGHCPLLSTTPDCGIWKKDPRLEHYWKSDLCSSSGLPIQNEPLLDRQLVLQFDNFHYQSEAIVRCHRTVLRMNKWYLNFPLSYAGTWKSELRSANQINLIGLAEISHHVVRLFLAADIVVHESQRSEYEAAIVSVASAKEQYAQLLSSHRSNLPALAQQAAGYETAPESPLERQEQMEHQEILLSISLETLQGYMYQVWCKLKEKDTTTSKEKEWCSLLEIVNLLLHQKYPKAQFNLPILDVLIQTELVLLLSIHLKLPIHLTDKTGLDRSGFARALWESLKEIYESRSVRSETPEENRVRRLGEILSFLQSEPASPDYPSDLNPITDLLADQKGSPVQFLPRFETPYHRYLKHVTHHLLGDAQAIALLETGVAGLKFNHDSESYKDNWGANPWIMRRMLPYIQTSDGRVIQIHDGRKFTYAGLQVLHRLSQLR